jgi:hypothetical protein
MLLTKLGLISSSQERIYRTKQLTHFLFCFVFATISITQRTSGLRILKQKKVERKTIS